MPTAVPPRAARDGLLLFAGFGALCPLVIAAGVTGLVEVGRSSERLDRMHHSNLQATARLGEIRADVRAAAVSARLILRSSITAASSIQSAMDRLDDEIDTAETTGADGLPRELTMFRC